LGGGVIEALGLVLSIPLPPEQFDKPYRGALYVIEAKLADVHRVCNAPKGTFACAIPMKGECLVVLPKVDAWITKAQRDRLMRHEIGHCNGWGADHKGGRY
jgi:hypothetical protein